MYLTFEEYQNMGGTLDELTFNDMEFEAECIVNWHTFNRLKKDAQYPDELKKCMKALVELIRTKSAMLGSTGEETGLSNAQIASQSNDGVSVSYNILSAADLMNDSDKEIDTKIRFYLQDVTNSLGHKLLYRGVYFDE